MAKKARPPFGSLMEMEEFFKKKGSEGGKASSAKLTPKQLKQRARKAGLASGKVRAAKAAKKAAAKAAEGRKKAAEKRKKG